MPLEQWKPKGKGKISWQGDQVRSPRQFSVPLLLCFRAKLQRVSPVGIIWVLGSGSGRIGPWAVSQGR